MYLVHLKTAIVEALRATFRESYPNRDFKEVYCSIDYPVERTSYPGIWVQYEDTDELHIAGIDHRESIYNPKTKTYQEFTRWIFTGTVTLTIAALTSMERDRLYDEVVRMVGFGKYNSNLGIFRQRVENNDLIAMNFNFDDLRPFGDNAAPGTPWQTDEIIYEKSLSINLRGEFCGDVDYREILPLSAIVVQGYAKGIEPVPTWPDGPFPPDDANFGDDDGFLIPGSPPRYIP